MEYILGAAAAAVFLLLIAGLVLALGRPRATTPVATEPEGEATVFVTASDTAPDAAVHLEWTTVFTHVVRPDEVDEHDVAGKIVLAADLDPRLAVLAAEVWILGDPFPRAERVHVAFWDLVERATGFKAWSVTRVEDDRAPDGDRVLEGPVTYDAAATADHVVLADGFRYRVTSAFPDA